MKLPDFRFLTRRMVVLRFIKSRRWRRTESENARWKPRNVNSGLATFCGRVSARTHRKSSVLESLQDNGGRKHVI